MELRAAVVTRCPVRTRRVRSLHINDDRDFVNHKRTLLPAALLIFVPVFATTASAMTMRWVRSNVMRTSAVASTFSRRRSAGFIINDIHAIHGRLLDSATKTRVRETTQRGMAAASSAQRDEGVDSSARRSSASTSTSRSDEAVEASCKNATGACASSASSLRSLLPPLPKDEDCGRRLAGESIGDFPAPSKSRAIGGGRDVGDVGRAKTGRSSRRQRQQKQEQKKKDQWPKSSPFGKRSLVNNGGDDIVGLSGGILGHLGAAGDADALLGGKSSEYDGPGREAGKPIASFFASVDETMRRRNFRGKSERDQEQMRSSFLDLPPLSGMDDDGSTTMSARTGNARSDSSLFGQDDLQFDESFPFGGWRPTTTPVPEPNPNSFHKEVFREYMAAMRDVLQNPKFRDRHGKVKGIEAVEEWLLRDERQIPIKLPTLYRSFLDEEEGGMLNNCSNAAANVVDSVSSEHDVGAELDASKLSYRELQRECKTRGLAAVGTSEVLLGRLEDAIEAASRRSSGDPTGADATKQESLARTVFRRELEMQKTAFLGESGLTDKQYKVAMVALSVLGDQCARQAITAPLEVAWEKIKEAGMIPRESTMNTYLYVVGNAAGSISGDRRGAPGSLLGNLTGSILDIIPDGSGSSSDIGSGLLPGHPPSSSQKKSKLDGNGFDADDEEEEIDLPGEVATFHDLLYIPTEKSISLRVKSLVAKGNATGAETLLNTLSDDTDESELKLRTYLPVLKAYCDSGDCSAALKLFARMRDAAGVILEPENYVLLIATLAENGYFGKRCDPIDGAKELGYSTCCGPELFDLLVTEMAGDVLEIPSSSARRLHNAFLVAHSGEAMAGGMQQIPSLAAMRPNNERASEKELVLSRVAIDNATGICPRTGAKLRLIMLERDEREEFREDLLKLADTQFHEFNRNSVAMGDIAVKELNRFADWLNERKGEPFTAIIDGANVAYFGQNFEQGIFNYYQVMFLVEALESNYETPLVIIPYKYSTKAFYSNTGPKAKRQALGKKELSILQTLKDSGKLYTVPAGCLDDYYWMLASVSDQTCSRSGRDLEVATDNSKGRWPGTRPMLLTNDQMRDHKLELLEPRLFRRWTSSYIVNYNFTAFVRDECVDREISFSAPDFFSREIQGNPTNGGTAWHFPVSDWDLNERFCIRIPA